MKLLRRTNLAALPGVSDSSAANPAPAHPANPDGAPSVPRNGGEDYQAWILENEPDAARLDIQRQLSRTFSFRPKISILVPVYRVPLDVLTEMVNSVFGQTYDHWELCITVPRGDGAHAISYLENASRHDPRVRVKVLSANEGISGNSNQALTLATGEFLALLDHDDTLAPFALFEVVQLLNQDRDANFIYSDKDNLSEDGRTRLRPLFKPQWSPEVMLNANYLTHLCVMRTEQVREIGGWRTSTDGAQDWDIFLRVIQKFGNVRHIPKVLYHWRQLKTSVASGMDAKPYATQGQILAIQDYCDSLKIPAKVTGDKHSHLRLQWAPQPESRISVICLSKNPNPETVRFSEELRKLTADPSFEIIVAGLEAAPAASAQERIERAVAAASGDILVFIDDAVRPSSPDWLEELTGPLQLSEVGLVGARITDATTRTLRHCGIAFTWDGRLEYPYAWHPENCSEQAGGTEWYRNWTAVSGACFAIRRDLWDEVGGLSGDLLYPRLDVQLCLKIQLQANRRILYNPYARLVQKHDSLFETFLRGEKGRPADRIRATLPDGDPYFSPNLDCRTGKVDFYRHPVQRPVRDYAADSRALAGSYDFSPEMLERSLALHSAPGTGRLDSITWFLPEFDNPFYGGVHTILRFAGAFQKKHNVRSQFCILGNVSSVRIREKMRSTFPHLAASPLFVLDRPARVNELPPTDAAICTLWTTAYASLAFSNTKRKFYFIQDDETLFYPAGSTSALVEASYGFGFYGLCNTAPLLERYAQRGGRGEFFNPCIDANVFHDRNRKPISAEGPFLLFCYGRPDHPRNCFEMLAAALRILKQRMAADVTIVTAGAEWDPKLYGLEGVVENLGVLNYRSTGALYRACDAGVAMMMTRHPSYLPMELMASGSLVVANRNPDTEWLLKDGENCLLTDPSATSLADRIEQGLRDTGLRRRVTARAAEMVQAEYSRWDQAIERIYRYMSKMS